MKRCGSHNCAQAVICTYHDSSSVSYLPSSTDLVHGAYSVRLRNFARAAEACDVSQPTLMELERINEIVSEEKGMIDAAIPHRQTA